MNVLGCDIDPLTMGETVDRCAQAIQSQHRIQQISINGAKVIAMRGDGRLRGIVASSELVTADGQSVIWSSRLLGSPLPERIAGIDLMFELLALAEERGYRVYIMGARRHVLERAVRRLQRRYPGLTICGWRDGYFAETEEDAIAETIGQTRPDIVFAALPSPRKEYWLAMHGETLRAPVQLGVGGSIDVVAGVTRRAPRWMQRAGLEWLFRMIQEPRRLGPRYATTNTQFIAILISQLVSNWVNGRWDQY